MTVVSKLLINKQEKQTESAMAKYRFFSLDDSDQLWNSEVLAYTDYLEKLVFKVSRKPKRLISHLQRIFYCFHANLNEPLFAAIVDLLFVLNKRGLALSWRIIMGCKSKLTSEQFENLKAYLKDENADIHLFSANQYSVLSRGLIGKNSLVQQHKKQELIIYDPLDLARDHIEYSQLDEAKHVLENAIFEHPEREDLHHELLALYRSTQDAAGFNKMLVKLAQSEVELINEWTQLNTYFKGRNKDG